MKITEEHWVDIINTLEEVLSVADSSGESMFAIHINSAIEIAIERKKICAEQNKDRKIL